MYNRSVIKILSIVLLVVSFTTPTQRNASAVNLVPAPLLVSQPVVNISPEPTSANVGNVLNASATVAPPTIYYFWPPISGQMVFKLYPPSDPNCLFTPVYSYKPPIWRYEGPFSTYTNTGFKTTTNGIYHWVGEYTGYGFGQSNCADGAVNVQYTSSSLRLSAGLSANTVTVGDTIHAFASLINYNIGEAGQVFYRFYDDTPSKCAGPGLYGPFTVLTNNGIVPNSPNVTIGKWGSLWMRATYLNNDLKTTAASDCIYLEVKPKSFPSLSIDATPAETTIGNKLNAMATLTFSLLETTQASGTIQFRLFEGKDCLDTSSLPISAVNISAYGAGPGIPFYAYSQSGTSNTFPSGGYPVNLPGDYSWRAYYSGDSTYGPQVSNCAPVVVKSLPYLDMFLSNNSTSLSGDWQVASAPVTGYSLLYNATNNFTGAVSYQLYGDPNCTVFSRTLNTFQVAPANSYWPSTQAIFNSPGPVSWQAEYSGDTYNSSVKSACVMLTVNKASPAVTIQLSASAITVNQPVTAAFSLASPFANPSGTLNINQYSDASCTQLVKTLGEHAVSFLSLSGKTNGAVFFRPGVVYWRGEYSGDSLNNPANSACTPLTISGYNVMIPLIVR